MRRLILPVLMLFVFAASIAMADLVEVAIADFSFMPDSITVTEGDTVRWTNWDLPQHTSTSDTAVWDSDFLSQGESFDFIFNVAGDYPYFCRVHPSMRGEVVVTLGSSIECCGSRWGGIKELFK